MQLHYERNEKGFNRCYGCQHELFCKEEIAKDFDKHFSRGCNIIEVTSLQPHKHHAENNVCTIREEYSFVARDADHIVFTLLSEYSRGAATIVHMLTSLMQKSEDNSRTGFELAKQQLKLHIAHLKLKQFFNSQNITLGSIVDTAQSEPLVTHEYDDISTSPQGPREDFTSDATHSGIDDDTMESVDPDLTFTLSVYQPGGVYETQTKASEDKELDALTSSVANTPSGL